MFAGTNDITGRENDKTAREVADNFIKLKISMEYFKYTFWPTAAATVFAFCL